MTGEKRRDGEMFESPMSGSVYNEISNRGYNYAETSDNYYDTKKMLQFPQPITITESITKGYYDYLPVEMERHS